MRDSAEVVTGSLPPLLFFFQWPPGHIAIVCAYAATHASTIAERAPIGWMSIPVCHQLVAAPSGSQPPVIGNVYGPGRGSPSTARVIVRSPRAMRSRAPIAMSLCDVEKPSDARSGCPCRLPNCSQRDHAWGYAAQLLKSARGRSVGGRCRPLLLVALPLSGDLDARPIPTSATAGSWRRTRGRYRIAVAGCYNRPVSYGSARIACAQPYGPRA